MKGKPLLQLGMILILSGGLSLQPRIPAADRGSEAKKASESTVASVNGYAPLSLRQMSPDLRHLSGAYGEVMKGLSSNSFHFRSALSAFNAEIKLSSNSASNRVYAVLAKSGFPRGKLNRFQVRVFKRDKIVQGPIYIERSDPDSVARELFETELEAGDIVWIIPTRDF